METYYKTLFTIIMTGIILQSCSPRITLQVKTFPIDKTCQITVGAFVLDASCDWSDDGVATY